MSIIKQCFRIATFTFAIAASQQSMAAIYLKMDDIPGESRHVESTIQTMPMTNAGRGGGAGKVHFGRHTGARGGLDRDIIRRSTDSQSQTHTRLPKVGATRLHGVEPDEID